MNESKKDSLLLNALAAAPGPAPADAGDRAWIRSVNETSAALLLGHAPEMKLPGGVWGGIQAGIASRNAAAARKARAQKLILWGGWAAAACLAVLWALQSRSTPGQNGVVTTDKPGTGIQTPAEKSQTTDGGGAGRGNDLEAADTRGLPRSLREQLRGSRDYQLVQSVETLRGEVGRLRAADAERYTPRNGVSRIVVMELGAARSKTDSPSRLSSDKLSDIVAAGISGNNAATPAATDTPPDPSITPKRPITLRPGDTWDGEFVVPAGDPLPDFSLLNLPPGVSIRYGSLPLNDPQWAENFHSVAGQDNSWYDQRNDVIWSPSAAHPGEFTGRRPGTEFNRDLFQYNNDPPNGTASAGGQATAATGTGEPLSAWTIYDETSGKGSIIVSDLEPAPEGMTYRLSFEDTAHSRTVTVGDLPALEDGSGRVYFDLGVPGYSPSKYRLDLVSRDGSTPVLQGPNGN